MKAKAHHIHLTHFSEDPSHFKPNETRKGNNLWTRISRGSRLGLGKEILWGRVKIKEFELYRVPWFGTRIGLELQALMVSESDSVS